MGRIGWLDAAEEFAHQIVQACRAGDARLERVIESGAEIQPLDHTARFSGRSSARSSTREATRPASKCSSTSARAWRQWRS